MLTCEWLPLYIRPFVSGKYRLLLRFILSSAFLNIFQFKCNIWSVSSRFYTNSLIRTIESRLLLFSRSQISGRYESVWISNKIACLFIKYKRKLPTLQDPKIIPCIPLSSLQSMHFKIHSSLISIWRMYRFMQLNSSLAILYMSHNNLNVNTLYIFP